MLLKQVSQFQKTRKNASKTTEFVEMEASFVLHHLAVNDSPAVNMNRLPGYIG